MTVCSRGHHTALFAVLMLMIALSLPMPASAADLATPAQFRHIIPTGDQELPLTEIDRLFLDGQYEQALTRIDTLLARSENVASATLHNRSLLREILGLDSTLNGYRQAFVHDPTVLYPAWYYGRALLAADSVPRATEVLQQAVDLDDRFGESSIDLARALLASGQVEAARNHLRTMTGRMRSDGEAYAELAASYLREDSREARRQASDVLAEAYAQFPFEPVLRLWAPLLSDLGDRRRAADLADEYLRHYPKSPDAPLMRQLLASLDPERAQPLPEYVHLGYPNGTPYANPADVLILDRQIRWKARWGLVKLGSVTAEITTGTYHGEPCWVARYAAVSTVPFAAVADTFYAWIDRDLRFTHRLDMVYHEEHDEARKTLEVDYDTGIHEMRIREPNGYWWYDRLPLPPSLFDATSQLWYTQQLVAGNASGSCTISVDHTYERTTTQIYGPDGTFKLDGREYPRVHLGGIMPYSGMAGLTGEFQGWYTSSNPPLPAKAKFKIFLGSITLDLIELGQTEFDPSVMESSATNRPQEPSDTQTADSTQLHR